MKRMKIHYYGLRYYYLVSLIAFMLFSLISLTILKSYFEYFLPLLFAISIVSTFVLGTYEFNRIAYMHRSILANKKPFYICSHIFGAINIIVLLGLFVGYAFLLEYLHPVDISFISNPYFYMFYLSVYIFAYAIGNFYGLTFIKYSKLNIFIIVILFVSFVYFEIKISKIVNYVAKLIYLQIPNLHIISLIIFIVTIMIIFINRIIFMKKN